jgi:hypothetical protein
MTIESRILFDPADIKAVIFECSACGARVSASAKTMDKPPYQCPMGHAWGWNKETGYRSSESPFRAFLTSLAKLQDPLYGQMGFKVFLEIDGSCGHVSATEG